MLLIPKDVLLIPQDACLRLRPSDSVRVVSTLRVMPDGLAGLLFGLVVASCSKPQETPALVPAPAPLLAPSSTLATSPPRANARAVKKLEDESPLEIGDVVFEGMVRPTKGGFDVRSVTLDEPLVRRWMTQAVDGTPTDPDWLLGARVRVTATLRAHDEPATSKGGLAVQSRQGTFFLVARLDSIELVKNAETLEGTLARSRGFFALADHLIATDALEWSLAPRGGHIGDHVRLRGQSRVAQCTTPQCLLGGSLPLFDVARAERLP